MDLCDGPLIICSGGIDEALPDMPRSAPCREDQRRRVRASQLTRIGEPSLRQPARDLLKRISASGLAVDQHVHREDQPVQGASAIRVYQEFSAGTAAIAATVAVRSIKVRTLIFVAFLWTEVFRLRLRQDAVLDERQVFSMDQSAICSRRTEPE
jgi:hypothetical protein